MKCLQSRPILWSYGIKHALGTAKRVFLVVFSVSSTVHQFILLTGVVCLYMSSFWKAASAGTLQKCSPACHLSACELNAGIEALRWRNARCGLNWLRHKHSKDRYCKMMEEQFAMLMWTLMAAVSHLSLTGVRDRALNDTFTLSVGPLRLVWGSWGCSTMSETAWTRTKNYTVNNTKCSPDNEIHVWKYFFLSFWRQNVL